MAKHGPTQSGFLGSTRYEVPGNPDMLIEIAEWEFTASYTHAPAGVSISLANPAFSSGDGSGDSLVQISHLEGFRLRR